MTTIRSISPPRWSVCRRASHKGPAASKLGRAPFPGDRSSVRFFAPKRFGSGGNSVFADGHAKFMPVERTLGPERFAWGKCGYAFGGIPIYQPGTTTNVNQQSGAHIARKMVYLPRPTVAERAEFVGKTRKVESSSAFPNR